MPILKSNTKVSFWDLDLGYHSAVVIPQMIITLIHGHQKSIPIYCSSSMPLAMK